MEVKYTPHTPAQKAWPNYGGFCNTTFYQEVKQHQVPRLSSMSDQPLVHGERPAAPSPS